MKALRWLLWFGIAVVVTGWAESPSQPTEAFSPLLQSPATRPTAKSSLPLPSPLSEAVAVDPEQAFLVQVIALNANTLGVRFTIADCCYLYRDKTRFSVSAQDGTPLIAGPRLGAIELPPGQITTDEFFGRTEVYRHELDIRLPLHSLPHRPAFALNVIYQGCAEKGVAICYEPITRRFPIHRDGGQLVVGPSHIVRR